MWKGFLSLCARAFFVRRISRLGIQPDIMDRWPELRAPIVLEGGHSPMLARPAALADALVAVELALERIHKAMAYRRHSLFSSAPGFV